VGIGDYCVWLLNEVGRSGLACPSSLTLTKQRSTQSFPYHMLLANKRSVAIICFDLSPAPNAMHPRTRREPERTPPAGGSLFCGRKSNNPACALSYSDPVVRSVKTPRGRMPVSTVARVLLDVPSFVTVRSTSSSPSSDNVPFLKPETSASLPIHPRYVSPPTP
jgi:hypothetical protein